MKQTIDTYLASLPEFITEKGVWICESIIASKHLFNHSPTLYGKGLVYGPHVEK